MAWNWQHKNWPDFTYDTTLLTAYEKDFLHNAGMLYGSLKHVSSKDQDVLKVMLISDEAYKTSEIEGELLNRDSLQSSIRKHFGLKGDVRRISPAEQGISEMMIDLYKNYHTPLSHEQLCQWHAMLAKGRRDLLDIGSYRTHDDAMQIVSGPMNRPRIHYEAPPSHQVKKEMDLFISWFNSTESLDPLTRAGIAHLYFESIHPFEDGNGRIGRAVSEKALSQSLQRPTLIAISHTIEHDKKKYYEALHQNSTRLDITEWLVYFCKMVLQAQNYTQGRINFLIEKAGFYQRFEAKLNERQQKVVARIFKEGIHGFQGGLSADNYRRITKTTASTATRDLQKLVELEAFIRTGERKGTRYYLNIDYPGGLL
ncbi:Fic family protein [Sinomicrobium weinanense]|uniref:Fic family protein n=1 Tax=Sinomicrobium weinanense TaxID=2842200 RepID=A0A926JSP0_9FLAO|nr:Fic family protein [Sinomicrobium weinanense]MBC9796802.1 Fic family protein [Sinomicrobium weinanense]MBU3123694.1 Fic family protein [Sinomicrobium weinanense]